MSSSLLVSLLACLLPFYTGLLFDFSAKETKMQMEEENIP
jgi:penicillin-binding protein-related factor A (putative recombinase)